MSYIVHNIKGYPILRNHSGYVLNPKEKKELGLLKFQMNNLYKNNFISEECRILDNPDFSGLNNFFDQYLKIYLEEVLQIEDKVKRINSWATLNKTDSYHPLHAHPNVFLSVCFYPQVKSGDLVFRFEKSILQEGYLFNCTKKYNNSYNMNEFTFPLTANDLVIFPGWIPHQGTPNNSNVDRVMIGANYFLTGNLGSDSGKDFLNL
tara:strand:+ start:282 stop:899 length:618 start_codon:yes stop_codon:yes gene_type:complete